MILKHSITLPELTGDEPRNAYVYLPAACEFDPRLRFPVLYMFDGHNVFFDEDATYGKSWGMEKYMDESETPLIIAAVECNHSPDHGRLSEYSPYSFYDPNLGYISGRGKQTMEWMVHSFKPMIDQHFPTLPEREHTFIAGSSMGGLISIYALLEYNHVFSRAAALSPSIWACIGELNRLIDSVDLSPDTVLYIDYGSRELERMSGIENEFCRLSSHLISRHVLLDSRIVPGGTHCEASWEKQIPFFMNTLLYQWE